MSSPTPPSPSPNPTTTTATATATATATTTTTADFIKSVARQRPRKHVHPAIYQTLYNPPAAAFPPPRQQSLHSTSTTAAAAAAAGGVVYPVASSGSSRGFAYPYSVHQQQQRPYSDIIPPSALFQQIPTCATSNSKVAVQSSAPEDNGLHNIRDKNGDGSFVIIRDRKVQVSEGTSIYAQCRSWLKNGFTLENQPQYVDSVKSLPKPLPASMVEATKEADVEMEEKMENVEHLSAKELLQQHVKHAKKVRGRLRNQRLQRIERYKDRLALLLPPVVDQQPKNDP